jgi:hypothetical protein
MNAKQLLLQLQQTTSCVDGKRSLEDMSTFLPVNILFLHFLALFTYEISTLIHSQATKGCSHQTNRFLFIHLCNTVLPFMQYRHYHRITLVWILSFSVSNLTRGFYPIGSASHRPRMVVRRSTRAGYSSTIRKQSVSESSAVELEAEMQSTEDSSSTLLLLEHVNLNVPDPASALPFYMDLLGCGLDPRRAANVRAGTVWANCGASQFHLPYGTVAQRIPGKIGLRFRADAWDAWRQRVASLPPCLRSCASHRYRRACGRGPKAPIDLATLLSN